MRKICGRRDILEVDAVDAVDAVFSQIQNSPRHRMKFPKIPGFHGVFQGAPNTAEIRHFDGRQVWWGKENKGSAKQRSRELKSDNNKINFNTQNWRHFRFDRAAPSADFTIEYSNTRSILEPE